MSKQPALVQALLKPNAYPRHPRKIELVQTQMSYVFLTGDYVYKIKKPVNLGYLDYTTLEKRRFFCQQELVLNRRLSPDVYLGVEPMVERDGQISIGGEGEVIEYAVKMKQLPRERTMDRLLAQNQVTTEMVTAVAQKVTAFHGKARTSAEISAFGKPEAILVNTNENFVQTEKYIGTAITPQQYQRIEDYTNSFVNKNKSLFDKRVKEGRIRDCHGDLHTAHICFSEGIQIFDCIEFNDRFRYGDVANELAFLAMDLDRYHRADLSQAFVNAYIGFSHDTELLQLLNFYKCYRAYVRGKVACFMLDDPYIKEKKPALAAAKTYFDLAYRYAREKPFVFITAGLVGTGKSTVAEALSKSLGMAVVSSDVTRKKLANIQLNEHRFEPFKDGIYSADFTHKTYDAMFEQASKLLSQGQSVILDASFKKREHRLQAKRLADEAKADFVVLECILDEKAVKKRLKQRLKEGSVSDGRWEIYQSQKKDFDKIDEFQAQNHLVLDTSQTISIIVRNVLERLF